METILTVLVTFFAGMGAGLGTGFLWFVLLLQDGMQNNSTDSDEFYVYLPQIQT